MEVPPTKLSAFLNLNASFPTRGALRRAKTTKQSQELRAQKNIGNLGNDTSYKGLETIPSWICQRYNISLTVILTRSKWTWRHRSLFTSVWGLTKPFLSLVSPHWTSWREWSCSINRKSASSHCPLFFSLFLCLSAFYLREMTATLQCLPL